jgi:two-component system cell cycle response regulator
MAPFYAGAFASLDALAASSGEHRLVDETAQSLRALASGQDAVYHGGTASLIGAREAPAAVRALRGALATLDLRMRARSVVASRISLGGTMLLMLLAALTAIWCLRRFDRLRQRLTVELHEQATHDPLTGLANRRKLVHDLADIAHAATPEHPVRLVVFDLNGFKAYNGSFGQHGGDLLLRRLSEALAMAVGPAGTCYRLGGDEFCALLPDGSDVDVVLACTDALSESGTAFSITSSYGSVMLPLETKDPDVAMQLADERLHADQDSSRVSVGQQTRDLAVMVLSLQEPDVEEHSARVAELASGVARRLGLSDAKRAEVVRTAELHDIGKIAMPHGILNKEGPLEEDEWEIVRRHPTVGATILSAAPALERVAGFVRCCHERYDGRGYPRGIAGADIPLASRIVFVCDAFDAMISDRSYRDAMSEEAALDQLARHAGTQFDPTVVAAFQAEHQRRAFVDRHPRHAETPMRSHPRWRVRSDTTLRSAHSTLSGNAGFRELS